MDYVCVEGLETAEYPQDGLPDYVYRFRSARVWVNQIIKM